MLYAYYMYTLLKVGEDSENSKRVLLYNLQTPHLKAFVVTYRVYLCKTLKDFTSSNGNCYLAKR